MAAPVTMAPLCAPVSRRMRVRRRVSMSLIATMRSGLDVDRIAAGVADVRIGQRDDLLRVGRIGEDFLIAGQRGVEHHFAGRRALDANACAVEQAAVG
jgi:hypothetical protein